MTIDEEVADLVGRYDLPLVIAALARYALYKDNDLTAFRDLNRTFERSAQKRRGVRFPTPKVKETQKAAK